MARNTTPMNRIRELREAAGIDQAELAARLGTSAQHVGRHERGERRLTIQWVQRYAQALEVTASEIIGVPELALASNDVEPATIDGFLELSAVSATLASRHIRLYRVVRSLIPDSGIAAGTIITVDESDTARAAIATGDVVLASLGDVVLVLRVYVAPATLITNMPGTRNSLLRLDDRSSGVVVIGRVIRPDDQRS